MYSYKVLLYIFVFLMIAHKGQSQQNRGWRPGEMEATLLLRNHHQAEVLYAQKINADMPPAIPGEARLYITPSELTKLRDEGLNIQIVIDDLNQYYAGWWDKDVPPGYYTYQQIIDIADSLAQVFPDICQKIVLGYSTGGHQLAALKISDNAAIDEPEPELMFEAGIHGDEVGGPENAIRFARDLCKGYGSNTEITALVDTREIWIWLMVNPDGRQSMSRYNDNYVDINRDGAYMWNGEGNSPAACSQIETKTMRNFGADHQFVIFTDYHSGTEYISYPWSYREDNVPDKMHIHQLASVYASTSGYNNIPYGQGFSGMYPINGSTKDFFYGSYGAVSWSIEISMSKQPAAASINGYYLKNKPAMLALVEKAGLGLQGTITDSLSGLPVPAIININNYYPCYNDPLVGDYHKYLTEGTYDVEIIASGYQTKSFEGINIPSGGTTTLNAKMVRTDDTTYARKVLGCYILNNNPSDEGFTPGAIGAVDYVNYSLGKNGWIILDMQDTIVNKPGNDIKVIETDGSNEGYRLYAADSPDGPWIELGTGVGTDEFDLGTSFSKVRFLKIKDYGAGSTTVPDAGFDLDAVANLHPAARPLFKTETPIVCAEQPVTFTDLSRGTPLTWYWEFEGGTPATSTLKSPVVTYKNAGSYSVKLTISDGYTTSKVIRPAYITVNPLPLIDLGQDTILCFDYQSVVLDAGNPGATYLWHTGDTTRILTTQCHDIDIIEYYRVEVTLPTGCKLSDSTGITCTICEGAEEPEVETISVKPNPVIDEVYVSSEHSPILRLTMTDLSGRNILSKEVRTNETSISLRDYQSGIYFLRIITDDLADHAFKILKI